MINLSQTKTHSVLCFLGVILLPAVNNYVKIEIELNIQVVQSSTQKLKAHQVIKSYNTAGFLRFLNLHWYKSTAPITNIIAPIMITMTPPTIPAKVAALLLLSDSEAVVMYKYS